MFTYRWGVEMFGPTWFDDPASVGRGDRHTVAREIVPTTPFYSLPAPSHTKSNHKYDMVIYQKIADFARDNLREKRPATRKTHDYSWPRPMGVPRQEG